MSQVNGKNSFVDFNDGLKNSTENIHSDTLVYGIEVICIDDGNLVL